MVKDALSLAAIFFFFAFFIALSITDPLRIFDDHPKDSPSPSIQCGCGEDCACDPYDYRRCKK